MATPPCKNCPDRTEFKQCEKTCEKWANYLKQKAIDHEEQYIKQTAESMIKKAIWRNKK